MTATNINNDFNEVETVHQELDLATDTATWNPPDFASQGIKDFINEYYPNGLVYLNYTFFAYENGYWSKLNEFGDVRFNITKYLSYSAKTKDVNELLKMLKLTCFVKSSEFKPDMNYICF